MVLGVIEAQVTSAAPRANEISIWKRHSMGHPPNTSEVCGELVIAPKMIGRRYSCCPHSPASQLPAVSCTVAAVRAVNTRGTGGCAP